MLISTYEFISSSVISENSSTKTIEYVFDKKSSDKPLDDTHLLSITEFFYKKKTTNTPLFTKDIYSFKLIDPLFKPPIS